MNSFDVFVIKGFTVQYHKVITIMSYKLELIFLSTALNHKYKLAYLLNYNEPLEECDYAKHI